MDKLSKNPNGFFLMVEGSKVDWAAHGNDPVGMATDFLAFDRACGAALEFARNNGETAVVIVPDHGNSGISLGRRDCKGYDKLTKDQLFHQFSLYKLTAEGFANKVNSVPNPEVQNVFRTYAGFELTPEEMNALNNCKDYKNSPIPEEQRRQVLDVQKQIRSLPKPVIAAVNGFAIGGGHVLHVVCDLTIASENAIFGQTGPRVGSFDAGFGSSYLARVVGPHIKGFVEDKAIPLRSKIITIATMWLSTIITSLLLVGYWWVKVLLGLISIGISWHILSYPTKKE